MTRWAANTAAALVLTICTSFVYSQTPPATTQSSDLWLWVESNRKEAIYRTGEDVDFVIQCNLTPSEPYNGPAKWVLFQDGLQQSTGMAEITRGKAAIRFKGSRPGFLRLEVEVNGVTRRGAAGVSVDEIHPADVEPADFDAFWSEQKRLLAGIDSQLSRVEVPSGLEGVRCYEVKARSAVGVMRGYLALPVADGSRKWPAMVTVRGSGVFDSQKEVAVGWAKVGMIVLDWNIHGLPHGRERSWYQALREGELKDYATRGSTSREEIYWRGIILRMLRAIDVACAEETWDGKHLIINGASQGGGLALIAGGLDPRVSLIIAQVPGMCDLTGFKSQRLNGWPRLIGNDPGTIPQESVVETARYFDAVNFAPRYHGEALLTVSFLDVGCPPTATYAAYNRLPGIKQMLNLPWLGHTLSPQGDAAVWEALMKHLGRDSGAGR